MSDVQLYIIPGNKEELTTTPVVDPKISNEQISKRRSATSPAALEMNSLPLPKSGKKNPMRARFSAQRFESGDWTVHRPEKTQPIQASFSSPAVKIPGRSQKTLEVSDEALIDRALELVGDFEKNQSV